ncbi:hypothetical protein ACTL32_18415 [Planococcus sp. FY231025]|uniref:hypothetical protein n=1 Tax=Planococcus sp. FY231025 TaxID=3455699 RepID=UPI003F913F90
MGELIIGLSLALLITLVVVLIIMTIHQQLERKTAEEKKHLVSDDNARTNELKKAKEKNLVSNDEDILRAVEIGNVHMLLEAEEKIAIIKYNSDILDADEFADVWTEIMNKWLDAQNKYGVTAEEMEKCAKIRSFMKEVLDE